MAITYPRNDILSSAQFVDISVKLIGRQEQSRQANGVTRGKDFGSPLWRMAFTTNRRLNADVVDFEAILNSLDGVIRPFYLGDLRRRYPRQYASGVFTDSGLINSFSGNLISFKSLPANFKLSRGDYFSFDYGSGPSRAYHQIMQDITANASGLTASVEVRPFIRTGAAANIAVTFKNPMGLFTLEPDSIDSRISDIMDGQVSFSAIQYL